MAHRNETIIQQEAFCLYLHKKLHDILEEQGQSHLAEDYSYFKKTCILFHKKTNDDFIFTFFIDCNGGGLQNKSSSQFDVCFKLLKESKIEELQNLEKKDLVLELKKKNELENDLKYVSYDFKDIQEKFKEQIKSFEYIANTILSTKEDCYLGSFLNLKRRALFGSPFYNINNRICAYIDILGFNKIIDALAKLDKDNNHNHDSILKTIFPFQYDKQKKLEEAEHEKTGTKTSGPYPEKVDLILKLQECQYTIRKQAIYSIIIEDDISIVDALSAIDISFFSDTIVLSFGNFSTTDESLNLKYLKLFLACVQGTQKYFLGNQILTKGAITYGSMYHYGTMYGGKAFAKAYELGDKENRIPIMKIDESITNIFIKEKQQNRLEQLLKEKDLHDYLKQDYLKRFYFLQINKPEPISNDKYHTFYSDEWLEFSCTCKEYDENTKSKYVFLKEYFEEKIS